MTTNSTQFLTDTQAVADAVKSMVQDPATTNVYIAGPTIRIIMDSIFNTLHDDDAHCDTHLILPALTGSEYLGSSFLYQLYRLSSKIRISPKSVHCMVCSRKASILISPGTSIKDQHLCAIRVADLAVAEEMYTYCDQMFKGGLSLRLTQE